MGVDHKTVRTEIEKIVGPGADASDHARTPPYTPRVRRSLVLAGSEAKALSQIHVGPEHIFLGLLREGGGVAAVVLKSLGVNMQTARAEILKELGRSQPGA
jgi:ATP-dependent Clp protease ATP-binding subunit ClpC